MLFPPSIPLFLSFPIVLNFQIGHLQQYFLISVIDLNLYMSWSDSLCIEATLQHIFARFDGNSVVFANRSIESPHLVVRNTARDNTERREQIC